MKLSEIIIGDETARVYGERDIEIENLTKDSRVFRKNGLFFCLNGKTHDGADYVKEAINNGAVAIVTENVLPLNVTQVVVKNAREAFSEYSAAFYGNPQKRLKIIAVVGTNGKTSVSRLIYKGLVYAKKSAAVVGTLGAEFNGEVVDTNMTTPDPDVLFSLLKKFSDGGAKYVVMELSAHAIYLKKTAPIEFEAVVFTNVSQDHLDYFESYQDYVATKKSAFSDSGKYFVVNSDDGLGREIYAENPKKTLRYGVYELADVFAVGVKEGLDGVEFVLNGGGILRCVNSKLLGEFNVYNLLATYGTLYLCGIKAETLVNYISNASPIEGRMEYVSEYNGGKIFVDYAHTPDGLNKSLSFLASTAIGKTIAVFGAGGDRDRGKRSLMGMVVGEIADYAVITSDNPRSEDPLFIATEIESGLKRVTDCYQIELDRYEAVKKGIKRLNYGDVLLIAGKGSETTQIIGDVSYKFSDKEAVKKIIKELNSVQ